MEFVLNGDSAEYTEYIRTHGGNFLQALEWARVTFILLSGTRVLSKGPEVSSSEGSRLSGRILCTVPGDRYWITLTGKSSDFLQTR